MALARRSPVLLVALLVACTAGDGTAKRTRDAQVSDASTVDASPADDASSAADAGVCDMAEGTYATRIVLDAYWGQPDPLSLMNPGRGPIEVFVRTDVLQAPAGDSEGRVLQRLCGVSLPVFTNPVTCTAHQLTVPDAAWDSPSMPSVATALRAEQTTSGRQWEYLPAWLGLGFASDDMDAGAPDEDAGVAPSPCREPSAEGCADDPDMDGQPGLRFAQRTDGATHSEGCGSFQVPYVYLALRENFHLGYTPVHRTADLYFGLTIQIGGTIQGPTCAQGSGSADPTLLHTELLGCTLGNGDACTESEREVVADALPKFVGLAAGQSPPKELVVLMGPDQEPTPLDDTPSEGPRLQVVRIADASTPVTCADIRNADFPPAP